MTMGVACGVRAWVARGLFVVAAVFGVGLSPARASSPVAVSAAVPAPTFRLGDAAQPFGWSTAVADFNTDGEPDVAVADRIDRSTGGYAYRIEFSISGEPARQVTFESNRDAITIRVADVDRDNDLDVVVQSAVSGEAVAVWLNDGHGRFTPGDSRRVPPTVRSAQSLGSRAPSPVSTPGLAVGGGHDLLAAVTATAPAIVLLPSVASRDREHPVVRRLLTTSPRSPPDRTSLRS